MNGILKGGFLLALCMLVTKVLGAIYRIPLTNFLGAEGIGIYQTVFPFYSILLTVSATGIPNALSKIIGEGKNAEKVLYKSIIAFGGIGLAGSLLMAAGAKYLSTLQGNPSSCKAYLAISPSVFFVSILSCFRGYFQGKGNMLPTGISQISEQTIKLITGLTLIFFLSLSGENGAIAACFAVTVSEALSLLFMVIYKHKKEGYKPVIDDFSAENAKKTTLKEIFKVVLPVTLTSIILPFSRFIDSFIVINSIKNYSAFAVSLYGLYSGAVESVVGVPVSLCYGIAVSALPEISKNKNGNSGRKVILYTLLLSITAGVITYTTADYAIGFLYRRLNAEEITVATRLLKISAMQVVLLPVLQASTLVLIGKDRLYLPGIFLCLGVTAKLILSFTLTKIPSLNIYGMTFSDIACYFVAGFCNLLYIISERKQKAIHPAISGRIETKT